MTPEDSSDPYQYREPLQLTPGPAPADSHMQVRERLSVDFKSDIVERTIAEGRSEIWIAWNRSLPINQLPTELLVSIFALVAAAAAAAVSNEESHPDLDLCYPKWTKVVKVCRHWRDVAYASPALWRAIVMRSTGYTQRALVLSTPATIDAFFVHCDSILQVLNIQLLRPHAHRLRLLSFQVIQKPWLSAAFSLLQGDAGMPALETLELPLGGVDQNPWEDDFEDVEFTSERFPRLRFLTIALTTVPLDVQVYSRLRKLSLTTCRGNSFHRFLDALAASTNLESLVITSTLQRIQGDWVQEDVPVDRKLMNPISLHHLKSLSLVYHPPIYTSRFLSHVLLSPTVSVWIVSDPEDVDERAVTETVSAMLPPNPSLTMPALALVTDISITVSDTKCTLFGNTHVGPRPPASTPPPVAFRVHAAEDEEDLAVHRAARDLLTIFKSAPLTTLALKGPCSTITLETWTALFSRFSLLETLALVSTGRTGGTNEKVFAGLMDAAPPAGSPIPCPGLRRIRFAGDFAEEALDVTLRCLEDRAEKGHRLEELTLSLQSYDREGDDLLFETEYLPRLKELVADARCGCVCY